MANYNQAARKAWETRRKKHGPTGVRRKHPLRINLSNSVLHHLEHIKGIGETTEEKISYIIKRYLDEKGLIGL